MNRLYATLHSPPSFLRRQEPRTPRPRQATPFPNPPTVVPAKAGTSHPAPQAGRAMNRLYPALPTLSPSFLRRQEPRTPRPRQAAP